jgi:hypothetical protein
MDEGNERRRWADGVDQSATVLGEGVEQIHVCDREGDHYELLAHLLGNERRFVVRLSYDRVLHTVDEAEARHISEALASVCGMFKSTVHVGARPPKSMPYANKKHPPREERDATLSFASTRVRIKRPQGLRVALPEFLELNLVRVWEEAPPPGEDPIEWILATTEQVGDETQIRDVANTYRLRWLIEEFFKAMKSGCAVEKRRFLQVHALQNIFAVTMTLAWQMLLMRALSRLDEQLGAGFVLTAIQIHLLVAAGRKLPPKQRPPPNPTLRQALIAIAALGGHLTRNGEPGWLTLAQGFQRLRTLEEGYLLALPDNQANLGDL